MHRRIRPLPPRAQKAGWVLLCLAALTLVCLWTAGHTGTDFLAHSAYDSYTKQAMAWRDGRIALDGDYPWLELAIYQGEYFVSFPPVPAIPMWALSFALGENTPSGLLTLLYVLFAAAVLCLLLMRYLPGGQSAFVATFAVLGGSLIDLAVSGQGFSGGVWYQAQALALLCTALAFYLLDGPSRAGWAAGLVCIALAVGCRPFHALYVPVLLYRLYRHVRREGLWPSLISMLPYVVLPGLIAVAYGVYNYARFGNPFEFGHAYLPELAQAGEGMFVPGRILTNIQNIFRPMRIEDGRLVFPVVSGFAVYFTCPLLFLAGVRAGGRAARRQGDALDALLAASILIHALLLLSHRTNGGWQYGTRYFCDLLPALVFLFARGSAPRPLARVEAGAMGFLIALNVYGSIVFHWM